MSFMSKIKDFFYDEEEIEEEVPKTKKEVKKPSKKINIYDIENEKNKSDEKEKQEISERELFKSERTFNFPVDFDEEPDFEPVSRNDVTSSNMNREKTEDTINGGRSTRNLKTTRHYSSSSYGTAKQNKKEEKTFKPTPIISPVYGILDVNYSKEDITDKPKTTRSDNDKFSFDTIRKTYDKLEEEPKEQKGIFYNLEETKEPVNQEKEDIKEEFEEEPYKKDEVIITYEQVDPDDSKVDEDDLEIEVPKITRSTKTKKKVEKTLNLNIDKEEQGDEEEISEESDDKILEDTKEQDLFNLIDNMYSDDEEDEEEDE